MQSQSFINVVGLAPNEDMYARERAHFAKQLQAALAGQPSSLSALPAYIASANFSPDNNEPPLIIIDAGGTRLRTYTKCMKKIRFVEETTLPNNASIDDFFDVVARLLKPLAPAKKKIIFVFSFPAVILPNGDAKIIGFNKETRIANAVDKRIRRELEKALVRVGALTAGKQISLAVINDAAATLLTGFRPGHAHVGVVLGTGFNIAAQFLATQVSEFKGQVGTQIINLEAGNYAPAFCVNKTDQLFFTTTDLPQDHQLEKMISGAYLGDLFLQYLKKAAQLGYFKNSLTTKAINQLQELSAAELDLFAGYENCVLMKIAAENDEDRIFIKDLVAAFFRRIVLLVETAVMATAQVMHSKKVHVTFEGSVANSSLFKITFDRLRGQGYFSGLNIAFVNDTVNGAATAASFFKI